MKSVNKMSKGNGPATHIAWGGIKSEVIQNRMEQASLMKLAGMRRGNMRMALENMEKAGFVVTKAALPEPVPAGKDHEMSSVVDTKVQPKMITRIQY